MKAQYAQAFLELIQEGTSVDTALAGLRASLEKNGHTKLLASILLEVQRELSASKGVMKAVITTATANDTLALKSSIDAALQELGVSATTPVKTVVDETLIGGFVATFNHKEHDKSYKKALTKLYESIIK
jgi:F0F1-type ATP synthase delta subunit